MGQSRGIALKFSNLGFSIGTLLALSSCGPHPVPPSNVCAPANLKVVAGEVGVASIFYPDPIASSKNLNLKPNATNLDSYLKNVALMRLTGKGVLEGKYASIVNHVDCDDEFNAYDTKNNFAYFHADRRFGEAMSYYYGDLFRFGMDQAGYLGPNTSIQINAHCDKTDNAFYFRNVIGPGMIVEGVCLGDSISAPTAAYADDGEVIMHEVQHSITSANYSPTVELNALVNRYEEAGALNEALSDFMSAMVAESELGVASPVDPKIFSRWALGTFRAPDKNVRGAHRCPGYDSRFPGCAGFPGFSNTYGSNGFTISYVYPDGLGWPFWDNFTPPGSTESPIKTIFQGYTAQEEIHNAGVLLYGALWDVYSALKVNHPSELVSVGKAMRQLVMEAVRHLPMPNSITHRTPVTFIGLASQMVAAMPQIVFLTAADRSAMTQALVQRGLYQFTPVPSDWMSMGPGSSVTPGLLVKDDPVQLKAWLNMMGADSSIVTQTVATGLNSQPDPGEVFVAWFDLQNNAETTAGGVVLSVSSSDPDLQVLGDAINTGYLTQAPTPTAQIVYSKVNGQAIVRSLAGNGSFGMTNTYFGTNPQFVQNFRTGIWFKVRATAPHGKVIQLKVAAAPANGVSVSRDFPVTIH